jgi:hypothetical protein
MKFDFKAIASKIADLAPGLGAAIGGPGGAAVGLGVKTLAKFFGIDPAAENAEVQIQEALDKMTPEQAIELKKIDKQFIVDMKKLDIDVFKLEVEDRNSARDMHKVTKSWVPAALTFCFFFLAAFITYGVFVNLFPEADRQLVGIVIGYVFSELKQATSFWLGSSKGSQDKTLQMGANFKR